MRAIYLNTDDNTGNGDSRIDWYRVTGAVTGTPVDEIHDATYGVTDDNTLLDADGCPIVECNQTYADVRRAIEKKERIMHRKQAGKIAAAIGTVDTSPANVARVLRDIVDQAIDATHQAHGGLVGADVREADELVAALEAAAPAVSSEPARNVVLPERVSPLGEAAYSGAPTKKWIAERTQYAAGWNDCLARVSELNPPAVREAEPTWAERVERAAKVVIEGPWDAVSTLDLPYQEGNRAQARHEANLALRAAFPDLAPEGE